MPTYQYTCTECAEALEVQQSFSDDSLTTCPACEGRLRKVYNAVGVVFKGSGFYRNDSRATNGEGGRKEAGDAAAPGSDNGSAKSSANGSDKGRDQGPAKGGGDGPDKKPAKAADAGAAGRAATSSAGTGSGAGFAT